MQGFGGKIEGFEHHLFRGFSSDWMTEGRTKRVGVLWCGWGGVMAFVRAVRAGEGMRGSIS